MLEVVFNPLPNQELLPRVPRFRVLDAYDVLPPEEPTADDRRWNSDESPDKTAVVFGH